MTGRSSARLLAPLALAAAAVALFAVLLSGGGDSPDPSGSASPAATATATPKNAAKRSKPPKPTSYTVQAGDTPSSIADQQDVDLDALLEANPDIDPNGLTPGEKLKLP